MVKETKNRNDRDNDCIKSPTPGYTTGEGKNTSHRKRKRKVLLPPKIGTVSRAVIKKAIRKIIANRPVSNEA